MFMLMTVFWHLFMQTKDKTQNSRPQRFIWQELDQCERASQTTSQRLRNMRGGFAPGHTSVYDIEPRIVHKATFNMLQSLRSKSQGAKQ